MVLKKIKKWVDGDSGLFSDGTKFRLAEVRAPEKYQFGGERATRRAAGMSGRNNGVVNWRPVGTSYGRQVGYMTTPDGSINQRLLRRGSRNKGR
ncbi:MAG: thermonuclease family protein [Nanoarchaeota archaeon]|nr:thermonuclease family protein [Nanoarchaeota archaeon]